MSVAHKIDGSAIAAKFREKITLEVEEIKKKQQPKQEEGGGEEKKEGESSAATNASSSSSSDASNLLKVPGLAVIIVGSRGDSQTYVNLKKKFATQCGFTSSVIPLPEESTTEQVVAEVKKVNADPKIHGLLVQLPLPKHVDETSVVEAIDPHKDVDGLTPYNVGNLFLRGRDPLFVPCTPQGVIELLKAYDIKISGKRAVVLGRSNIVGLPVYQLLQQENATVTLVHSKSEDIPEIVKQCDIVIAAVGHAGMVKGDWIKKGAAVIDVGTNPIPDSSKASGIKLVGDCDFESVQQNAGFLTPVPGGVGPMTIAMLLRNTLTGFKRAEKL